MLAGMDTDATAKHSFGVQIDCSLNIFKDEEIPPKLVQGLSKRVRYMTNVFVSKLSYTPPLFQILPNLSRRFPSSTMSEGKKAKRLQSSIFLVRHNM